MKNVSWFRAVLSGFIGLVVAVIVTSLTNLLNPSPALAWVLVPVCLSSLVSALAGYLIGERQKHKADTAR